MRLDRKIVVALVAGAVLSACGDAKPENAKVPAGQVVATADGQEVTLRELQAELAGATFADAKQRKAGEQAALQAIIRRKLIAKAAVEAGIDKTPDFALQKQRAGEVLLAQAYEAKIAADVPPPTRDEALSFVTLNPDIFAERKIFTVDQIRIAAPSDPAVMKEFTPLKTLEEVEQLLTSKKIEFQKGVDRIDTVGSDPNLVKQILALPPGEVFVIPRQNILLINRISATQVVPFTGEPAVNYALQLLKYRRTQETVSRQFTDILKKSSAKVKFNKDYEPPKPPAAPAAPAAAAPTKS